jgi:hypothetical protein
MFRSGLPPYDELRKQTDRKLLFSSVLPRHTAKGERDRNTERNVQFCFAVILGSAVIDNANVFLFWEGGSCGIEELGTVSRNKAWYG